MDIISLRSIKVIWAANRLQLLDFGVPSAQVETAEDVARSGTDQAGDNPVTSPAYTNPDGEVGNTLPC